jgi:hypothetical protein
MSFFQALQFRDFSTENFMLNRQDAIVPHMRSMLIDWIVEVAEEFAMSSDVLHLAVAIVDRALKVMTLTPDELQLLGCACMLVASKFDDVLSPNLDEFVQITDRTYKRDQILHMEAQLLRALEFRIVTATGKPFLRRVQRAARVNLLEKSLSNFFLELTFIDESFAQFTPSLCAASAIYYARLFLFKNRAGMEIELESGEKIPCPPMWSPEMKYYSGYDEEELAYCTRRLRDTHSIAKDTVHAAALIRKFSTKAWSHVSSFEALSIDLLPPITMRAIRIGGR